MNYLRSKKDIGKTKRTRSRTHGGDRKARPITNHDGRRIRGVWGSNRREDIGIWGGVEGLKVLTGDVRPMALKDCASAAWPHPPGQAGCWLGGAGGVQNGADRRAAPVNMAAGWG